MTPEQFTYWLQGFMELTGEPLTKREQIIKDHLAQVFVKKTPDYGPTLTYTEPIDPGFYIKPQHPPYPNGVTYTC